MSRTDTEIRQNRIETAFLLMHQEAARGMRLFVLDRHYKPFVPLALRRLRTHLGLPRARKPYLRLKALTANYEQIEEAYERRYNRIEKKGGDAEWFADKWQLGLHNVGKGIPYTAAFAQEFPNTVQAVELWRLTNWLQEQCAQWPLGACDYYDYQYLEEVLQEPLLRGTATQPHLLNKAIEWLKEQCEQARSAVSKSIIHPRKLEDLFIEPHSAVGHIDTMTALLIEWNIVSHTPPYHYCLGELKGRAGSIKGVFPSLYRALADTRLIKPCSVEIWVPLFCRHFAVSFTNRYAYTKLEESNKTDKFYLEAVSRFTAA